MFIRECDNFVRFIREHRYISSIFWTSGKLDVECCAVYYPEEQASCILLDTREEKPKERKGRGGGKKERSKTETRIDICITRRR